MIGSALWKGPGEGNKAWWQGHPQPATAWGGKGVTRGDGEIQTLTCKRPTNSQVTQGPHTGTGGIQGWPRVKGRALSGLVVIVGLFSGQEMTRNCRTRERGTQELLVKGKLVSENEKRNLGPSHIFHGDPGGSETEADAPAGEGCRPLEYSQNLF